MTSVTAEEKSKRLIHTAGCIIIGDEVLGGKVCSRTYPMWRILRAENLPSDCGYELGVSGQVLLQVGHESETGRGDRGR